MFEENIHPYLNKNVSITPLKGVFIGSSVTPMREMKGSLQFGRSQFGSVAPETTNMRRNQVQ